MRRFRTNKRLPNYYGYVGEIAPEVQSYFDEQYQKQSWKVYKGNWPRMKTKEDVDRWIENKSRLMEFLSDESIAELLGSKELKQHEMISGYEAGVISFEEFHEFMWSSGRFLFQEIGEDMYVFYLNAAEGEFYPQERKQLPTNYDWCD